MNRLKGIGRTKRQPVKGAQREIIAKRTLKETKEQRQIRLEQNSETSGKIRKEEIEEGYKLHQRKNRNKCEEKIASTGRCKRKQTREAKQNMGEENITRNRR